MFERFGNYTQYAIKNFIMRLEQIILTNEEADFLIGRIEERREKEEAARRRN